MATTDEELAHTATAPGASEPRTPADPVGETLGRYRLERMLGEGGMGVVHAAFDPDLERRVALKVLRTADGSDEARQRLLREARAMARLTHANVVAVHEVGTAGDRDYVAMELIDGQTLADWLDTTPRRSVRDITAAFVAAGRGVAAAHAAGLVHRDFKPRNVLRGRDGRIVVTDFGLARGVEASKEQISLETTLPLRGGRVTENTPSSLSGLTRTGSVLGTPAYMAPEQWSGDTVGPAADQFAFCVALWEALTGERPYRGDTIEALKARLERGPADLDASKLPRALRRPLLRGLEPEAAKRWPSMDALLAAITRHQRGPSFAIASAGAVLVAAGIAFVAFRADEPPRCDPPSIDPDRVWSATIAGTTSPELAPVFAGHVRKWQQARSTACTADPATRTAQLRCLDGVLARVDVVRQAYGRFAGATAEDAVNVLVAPTLCLSPAPPRLTMPDSPDVITALSLYVKTLPTVKEFADPKDAQAFADRAGLEPCARALALDAVEESSSDIGAKRAAINEAVATADQCDDDRIRAQMLIRAVPFQFELPVIGPKGEAAIRRADAAVQRIRQPSLEARIDFLRAFVASQHEHWKEAFDLTDHASTVLDEEGLHRYALALVVESLEFRLQRGTVEDLEHVRSTVATWKPVAARRDDKQLLMDLERDDAFVRWALGDVVGGHAGLVRFAETPTAMDNSMKIEGEVVDRTGKPVAGATVAAARALLSDSVGVPLPAYRLHYGDRDLRWVTTDTAGHFEMPQAPDRGAIIAQLGDRRSIATPIAAHMKLVVEPTRRISGSVALGSVPSTETIITIASANDQTDTSRLIAPIAADGSFAVDGAPTGKLRIAVSINNKMFGTQQQFKEIAASPDAVTGISLTIPTTSRSVEVVARSTLTTPLDTAQILIVPGRTQPANVGELMKSAGSNLLSMFAHHVVGEAVPHDAVAQVKPGDLIAHFANVPAGEVTVCVIGLSGDLMDPALMTKIQAHVNELEIRCETLDGDAKVVVITAPPQKRFD